MFVNNDEQQFELLEPGVHRMKVSGHSVKPNGSWSLTFKKGKFKTTGFGNNPYLKEDGTPEQWANVVQGWAVGTKIFFEGIMGKEETNRVFREVEADIRKRFPTQEQQFASLETIQKEVESLLNKLLDTAEPYFKSVWFDVNLEPSIYIDDEGNEVPTLRIPKKDKENNYYCGYEVSKDQTNDSIPEQVQTPVEPVENVPDEVNNEPKLRQEPEEW